VCAKQSTELVSHFQISGALLPLFPGTLARCRPKLDRPDKRRSLRDRGRGVGAAQTCANRSSRSNLIVSFRHDVNVGRRDASSYSAPPTPSGGRASSPSLQSHCETRRRAPRLSNRGAHRFRSDRRADPAQALRQTRRLACQSNRAARTLVAIDSAMPTNSLLVPDSSFGRPGCFSELGVDLFYNTPGSEQTTNC
jgi:hypothetical protein